MKIIIDLTAAEQARVETAYADKYNYQEMVDDPNDSEKRIDNPESIADIIKKKLIEKLEEETSRYEFKLQREVLDKTFQRLKLGE